MKTAWYLFVVVACCVTLSGCGSVNVDDVSIFDRYYLTNLKQSSSADIIGAISANDNELMSQSESVIASWTEEKKGFVFWFNMVAFDQEELLAVRKYCMVFDEKAAQDFTLFRSIQKLRFEAAMVLQGEILAQSYANENERRIAFLNELLAKFEADSSQLTADSRVIDSSSMVVKQILNAILYQLELSPATAANLDGLSGIDFDHMTLGKSKARMIIEDDVVKLKVKIGSNRKDFEEHPDVLGM